MNEPENQQSEPNQEPETAQARSLRSRTREAYRVFLDTLPPRTNTVLRWLTTILIIIVLFRLILVFFSAPEKRSFDEKDIVQKVRTVSRTIAERVTKLRDVVAIDDTIRKQTSGERQALVFSRLIEKKKRFDDSLNTFIQQEHAPAPDEQYSVAIYGLDRRLLAWNSTMPLRSPWDSILIDIRYIEHKSRAIYVDRHGQYVWLVALRKISDTSALGYVVSRALLSYAASEKHTNAYTFNFLDQASLEVEHVLDIDYSAKPRLPLSNDHAPYGIIAEQGEPATFIGTLRVGEATTHTESGLLGVVLALQELLAGALIYFFIGSIIYVLLKQPDIHTDPKLRFQICEVVIALFVVGRAMIMLLGNFKTLLPESVRDTDVFGIADLGGIAGNPIELLLTSLSLAICATIVARIVTLSDGPKQVSLSFWKFTLYFLGFIGFQLLLVYAFREALNGIIVNSTVSYYPITQAIPDIPELCVYFAVVSIGFVYCVAVASALIWFLTASVPLMRLENYEVLVGRGIVLVIVVLLFTIVGFLLISPSPGLLLTNNYWLIITIPILTITAAVWLVHLNNTRGKMLSKFSIISGLAILVLVSSGSLVVAPLVASFEFENKVTILEVSAGMNNERTFEHAARLEAAFMRYAEVADTDKTNLAYDFWSKHLRDEELASWVIVSDGKQVFSEYGQAQLQSNAKDLLSYAVSLSQSLGRTGEAYAVRMFRGDSLPFSSTQENMTIGVLRIDTLAPGTMSAKTFVAVLMTTTSGVLPEAGSSALFFTTPSREHEPAGIVRAVFEDNTLRQTSDLSLNIPSHLPAQAYSQVQHSDVPVRINLTIDEDQYLFIAHRAQSGSRKIICSGLRVAGLGEVFEIALHIHFIGILLAILFAILNFGIRAFFSRQQQVFIRFRERILLIVVALAFIPLILVTNVTRSLLAQRALTQEREQLSVDANAAAERLKGATDTLNLSSVLRQAASTLRRSLQLYDMRGILRLANDDKLVLTGFISTALDVGAVREILVNGKNFAIEDVRVGTSAIVRSAFQVLPSAQNDKPLGILAIRKIDSATSLEADIAATISFIYGVFAAIAVLLLLIGALFAYLLSRPISKVIQATEQVAGGAYGVIVPIDRNDEMGDLANAFNRMSLELDKSRERLAQSEREVAWKEMARQVAHEIKNPLTPMKLSVQHVEHAYETKDENFSTIFRRVMRTLSEQIAVLTRIATEFSRFGEMPRRRYAFTSLKKVLESAVALFDADRGRIRFVVDIPEKLSAIYADEEEFRRSLVNLIRNAVQAIEGWGVIVITAKERHGIIHLMITDTGSGIPKETLARIFDPNFSTKTSGMGLGLAIVKRSITDMSGQIWVESEVGKGTTFHIELPAREYPAV